MLKRLQHLFSNVKRGNFANLATEDIHFFQNVVGKQHMLTDPQDLKMYNKCYLNMYIGQSKLVLLPQNTKQVSAILKYCNNRKLAVVPQGGNTGLVGGSVPVFDQIILSMRKFNKIEGFDQISGVLSCQAGCVLEKLNDQLGKHNYQVPLDLGAKGSCHIGGNASTHAAGKYLVKHGPLRGNILGLETVVADGTILDMRSTIRKDNTGIDLKQLFIGSEGTLGIITKLDINCAKIDKNRQVILLKTTKYQNILVAVEKAKHILGKNLNAIEYMDGYSYKSVTRHLHPSVMPVNQTDHLLLIELTTEDIGQFLQAIPDFDDSIMSTTDKQYKSIWKIRQDIAEAANRQGLVFSYDISFNIREWNGFVERARKKAGCYVIGYGHIGDGNLHLNVCMPKGKTFDQRYIFEQVTKSKGSISAEHGVGLHKPEYLKLQKSHPILKLCGDVKKIFDPNGILNPYKVYDPSV